MVYRKNSKNSKIMDSAFDPCMYTYIFTFVYGPTFYFVLFCTYIKSKSDENSF